MKRIMPALLLICAPATAQVVDITVIDVGQGDSILVEFPEGRDGTRKRMLIDGGRSTSDENAVLQFLNDQNIDQLDIVVVTHPHDDHFAGLTPVLKQLDIEEIWWNGERRGPPRDAEWQPTRSEGRGRAPPAPCLCRLQPWRSRPPCRRWPARDAS